MINATDCCQNLLDFETQKSPFTKILVFGYYDGETSGIAQCGGCGMEYKFDMLAWDDMQDMRVYVFSRLDPGWLSRFEDELKSLGEPNRPVWVPIWSFHDESTKESADRLVDDLKREPWKPEFVIATEELSRSVLIFRKLNEADRQAPLDQLTKAKYWLTFLGIDPKGHRG